jgi:hypothetical protein
MCLIVYVSGSRILKTRKKYRTAADHFHQPKSGCLSDGQYEQNAVDVSAGILSLHLGASKFLRGTQGKIVLAA